MPLDVLTLLKRSYDRLPTDAHRWPLNICRIVVFALRGTRIMTKLLAFNIVCLQPHFVAMC